MKNSNIGTFSLLTKKQKESIAILSIGAFLEYFDLMIYIHMGTLLNELFFPKTDPQTAILIQAFGFCSIFIFRPIGALIFGFIGDRIGRKSTIVITTSIMAISCIVMANLPTYDKIGIISSWVVTICRILQGISAFGEIVGSGLYLTETTKPPVQYPIVGCITIFSVFGTVCALVITTLILRQEIEWRIVFWLGAIIIIIGGIVRKALSETSEFIDAKQNFTKTYILNSKSKKYLNYPIPNVAINYKTVLFLFVMNCEWPICFYFIYIYCGDILKYTFGYSAQNVIEHNFRIALIQLAVALFVSILSYKIDPLKIIKMKISVLFIFILFCPLLLKNTTSPFHLFLMQTFILLFSDIIFPGAPIFFRHLPIFKRFTYSALIYAISRALMYVITSFGMVLLIKYFGFYGALIVVLPIIIGCYKGVYHFSALEEKARVL